MNNNEKVYTVTVKTKNGKRVIVVPKKDYEAVKKGDKVEYKNGQLAFAS